MYKHGADGGCNNAYFDFVCSQRSKEDPLNDMAKEKGENESEIRENKDAATAPGEIYGDGVEVRVVSKRVGHGGTHGDGGHGTIEQQTMRSKRVCDCPRSLAQQRIERHGRGGERDATCPAGRMPNASWKWTATFSNFYAKLSRAERMQQGSSSQYQVHHLTRIQLAGRDPCCAKTSLSASAR